ncbi:peptide deformylase, partial [candidate division KSB1 bacterium]
SEENKQQNKKDLVYINPKIKKTSKKLSELEEGCLSVEGYSGTVTRSQQVTVEAYDEHGVKFTRGASGLLAQIFQHEIDHLNGVLYIDHARDIKKLETPEETKNE